MPSVAEHYERVLSPVYAWMAGGAEAAITAGGVELEALNLELAPRARVVDLGCGFGMHAIPLARAGARVLAMDTSAHLLAELARLAGDLDIETVQDDLLSFRAHLKEKAAAVFCMGDTLTHLPEHTNLDFLVQEVAEALAPAGWFVLSFRDYSQPLLDDQRSARGVQFVGQKAIVAGVQPSVVDLETVARPDVVHLRPFDGE